MEKIFKQDKPLSIINIFFTIIGVSLVRTFLENFSSLGPSDPFTTGYAAFTHFIYFYFSILLSLAILLYFLTKVYIEKIISFIVTFFTIILLPPLIDLLITGGKGWEIGYNVLEPSKIIPAFFSYFGPLQDFGVTPGIRLEISLILIGIFFFTYYHTKNILLSVFGIIGGYLIFFFYAGLPSLIATPWLIKNSLTNSYLFFSSQFSHSWLNTTHSLVPIPQDINLRIQNQTEIFMARIFWISTIIQSALVFKIFSPSLWKAWKNNLRIERVLYYCAIGILGMFIYEDFLNPEKLVNLPNILSIIIFLALIALNAWFAVSVNDETDIEIDKISNPDRPLVKNTISTKEMRAIGFVIFIYIISGVVLLNYATFYLLLMFQAVYFIYSAYPLRLKRFVFFSSPLLGLNALAIAMGGFFLVSPDQHIAAFPKFALWSILMGFTLVANVKDIKDFEGDKAGKIQTIPTIFGLKKGRLIIGMLCMVFLLLFGFLSGSKQLFFSTLPFAAFLFYLINMRNYKEIYLFYLFFAYIVLLSILISQNAFAF